MKKLSILAVAFAAIAFAACGNKSAQNTESSDSTVKSFEQEQIEASIKMHVDSLASEIGKLKQLPFLQENSDGTFKLTKEELQVKPDYLLNPSVRILSGFRDRGFSIDAAIDMTANVVGVPEYQIKSYTEKYKIDYPEISVSTKEYILGQEDAKSLATTGVGRHSDVADAMYEKQMKYLSRNNDFDAKSYLAGMCHMCVFSQNDLDKLREEGRVLSYKTKL